MRFSRSERAVWVGAAFLVSATAALAASLAMMLLGIQGSHGPGIAVKDDIAQNGFFALCAFALADMARRGRAPVGEDDGRYNTKLLALAACRRVGVHLSAKPLPDLQELRLSGCCSPDPPE